MSMRQIPPNITEALRLLDTLPAVRARGAPTWSDRAKKWLLELDVHTQGGPHVPPHTAWVTHIPDDLPLGEIKIYPHKDNGLEATFPHQNNNEPAKRDTTWRTGDVCLATPFRVLGRAGPADEPGDTRRLHWHVERLLEWLDEAAKGALTGPGQPFELPHFDSEGSHEIAYAETPQDFAAWSARAHTRGTAITRKPWGDRSVHAVVEFRDEDGEILCEASWGDFVRKSKRETTRAAWIRIPGPPIIEPWQAPRTWAELRDALAKQGVALDEEIRPLLAALRDAEQHILLLGFPIPATQGAPAERIHWQGIRLPALRQTKALGGGHRNEDTHDMLLVLRPDHRISWLKSANWADDQLLTRGRLSSATSQAHVALLGAGAVGSLLAEPLLRAGMRHIVIVDGETLAMGNLARHSLNAHSVGGNKAAHLVGRARAISPHVSAYAIEKKIQDLDADDKQRLQGCDTIIEATGSRDAPTLVEQAAWATGKLVVVTSVAPDAERLHLHASRSFTAARYTAEVGPLLEEDLARIPPSTFPREGLGCWHPVFPAAHPDIQAHCGIATRIIDDIIVGKRTEGTYIIEKTTSPDIGFQVRRIHPSTGGTTSAA